MFLGDIQQACDLLISALEDKYSCCFTKISVAYDGIIFHTDTFSYKVYNKGDIIKFYPDTWKDSTHKEWIIRR